MNRAQRLAYNKGERYTSYSTTGELAKALGVSTDTVDRWRKSGAIPAPEARAANNWLLWSPEQVRRIIHWRTNRGEARGN